MRDGKVHINDLKRYRYFASSKKTMLAQEYSESHDSEISRQ